MVYAKNRELAEINFFDISDRTQQTYRHEDEISAYKLEALMRKGATRNARRKDRPKQFYPIYVSKNLKEFTLAETENYYQVFPIEDGEEWIWSNSPSTLQQKIDARELIAKRRRDGSIQILFKRRIIDYKGERPKNNLDRYKV